MKTVIFGCVFAMMSFIAPISAQDKTFDAAACERQLRDPSLAPHPLKCDAAPDATEEANQFIIVFDVGAFETMKFDQTFRSARAMENVRLHQVGP
jgi:hypothetical protein